jgi:hypothetical protein
MPPRRGRADMTQDKYTARVVEAYTQPACSTGISHPGVNCRRDAYEANDADTNAARCPCTARSASSALTINYGVVIMFLW